MRVAILAAALLSVLAGCAAPYAPRRLTLSDFAASAPGRLRVVVLSGRVIEGDDEIRASTAGEVVSLPNWRLRTLWPEGERKEGVMVSADDGPPDTRVPMAIELTEAPTVTEVESALTFFARPEAAIGVRVTRCEAGVAVESGGAREELPGPVLLAGRIAVLQPEGSGPPLLADDMRLEELQLAWRHGPPPDHYQITVIFGAPRREKR